MSKNPEGNLPNRKTQPSGETVFGSRATGKVVAVDPDVDALSRLAMILEPIGFFVVCFEDPELLLSQPPPEGPFCLIMDVDLGGELRGIDLHRQAVEIGWKAPTLFLSACHDVRKAVKAMRGGAYDYLTKPVDPDELVAAVSRAMEHAERTFPAGMGADHARALVATLTPREIGVVRLVVSGLLNKEIADRLSIALVTVKVHRGRAMRKLNAGNPAELAYIATLGGIGRV